jgi:hypothetical protein
MDDGRIDVQGLPYVEEPRDDAYVKELIALGHRSDLLDQGYHHLLQERPFAGYVFESKHDH